MVAAEHGSLMTPLGLIEGEVLMYLEAHGATPLRRLTRELAWPSPLLMMGVGALVREGLVQAVRHDLELIIELCGPVRRAGVTVNASERTPKVAGG